MASIQKHLEDIAYEESSPLWDYGRLNMKEYRVQFPVESLRWFPPPSDRQIGIAASKTSGDVLMNPLALVRSLMQTEKWKDLFPCLVVDATVVEGGYSTPPLPVEIQADTDCLQIEISAKVQLVSPFSAVREMIFTRTSYRLGRTRWLVVDLPMPLMHLASNSPRQLPYVRGCLVRPSRTQGLSNVIWVEMTQFFLNEFHPLYRSLSEEVIWSERWFNTLSRECRRRVSHGHFFSPTVSMTSDQADALGKLVRLAKEMSARLYSCLSAATPTHAYEEEFSFAIDGAHWTATKSLLINKRANHLFDLVVSLHSPGHTLLEIPSNDKHNCISLHSRTDGKKVVQETCFDNSLGNLIIADLDVDSIIKSIRAFSIHPKNNVSSFLTVTLVMQPESSSSLWQAKQIWEKEVSSKIHSMVREIEMRTLV